MLKPSYAKNARRRNQARRHRQRPQPSRREASTPHRRAIRRLSIELAAEEGLFCVFHGGVDWRCAQHLLPRGAKVAISAETPIVAGGRRYVPDLKVTCPKTHRLLLLIEVWHSHSVSPSKRLAYNRLGVPWVEVLSWHVLHRHRDRPLPVLDWGGAGLPEGPCQQALFDGDAWAPPNSETSPHRVSQTLGTEHRGRRPATQSPVGPGALGGSDERHRPELLPAALAPRPS